MDIFRMYYTIETLIDSINASIFNLSFLIMIALIVIDILTGTVKAIKQKEWNSTFSKLGVLDHLLIITIIFIIDLVTNLSSLNYAFTFAVTFKLFFIGSYIGSIVENLGEMGINLPKSITKYFDRL